MNEEIKISWKGDENLSASGLFVGLVEEISINAGKYTVLVQGKNIENNKLGSLFLSESFLDHKQGISNINDLSDMKVGDILSIKEKKVRSVYRPTSPNNILFATIRCNSNCLMCSQPPLDVDDTIENFKIWNYAIDLISSPPKHITITGGEPTLLGEKLVLLINKLLNKFNDLLITVLSNGRMLALDNTIEFLKDVIEPQRVVFAIPLYSDIYKQHDNIVQAKDAFHQTCLGIHKISSIGFPVEIRVVLHKLSNPRLLYLSKFIHKNFPFVYHITFMGLEIIGYTRGNKSKLIEENTEGANEKLLSSLNYLSDWNYNVSIYNTPLCQLPAPLWPFAKQSISDWKNSFKNECEKCIVKNDCSGMFSWNLKYSNVQPFL